MRLIKIGDMMVFKVKKTNNTMLGIKNRAGSQVRSLSTGEIFYLKDVEFATIQTMIYHKCFDKTVFGFFPDGIINYTFSTIDFDSPKAVNFEQKAILSYKKMQKIVLKESTL